MSYTLKRTLLIALAAIVFGGLMCIYAETSHAAQKKAYKVPVKMTLTEDDNDSYNYLFTIKKGKMKKIAMNEEDPIIVTYKSKSKILLQSTGEDTHTVLTLKCKKYLVKKASFNENNYFSYKYGKKNRFKKITMISEGNEMASMTFTRNKKGDPTKMTIATQYEGTPFTQDFTFENTYKKKLLKKQVMKSTTEDASVTFTYDYKKVKMTPVQYKQYMNLFYLVRESLAGE